MLDKAAGSPRFFGPARLRKNLIRFLIPILCIVVLMLGYADLAEMHLRDEISAARRNPETGVIAGTEAVTLAGTGGRACLLIHGWIGSRIDFNDLGQRLNDRGLTVRMLRLPGHGTTPRALARMEAGELVRTVEAEYLALKREHGTVAVVGFSMGGSLATILAARHPVDRLALVAPFYAVTYKWYYVFSPEIWNTILSPIIAYVIKAEDFIRVNKPEAKEHIFTYRTVPTRGDMAASPAAIEDAFGRMGSAEKELFRCDRSNHHILWDYDGEAAAEEIVEFLAGK